MIELVFKRTKENIIISIDREEYKETKKENRKDIIVNTYSDDFIIEEESTIDFILKCKTIKNFEEIKKELELQKKYFEVKVFKRL